MEWEATTVADKQLDITPTPDVLVALTHTPLKPLDAVSELIDNSIDSFRAGEASGKQQRVRQVWLEVPGQAEVDRGEGLIRVRDSGPGLATEQIAQAMRAGYSSKNKYGTLGLFGMGFNIATGKLGRVTTVTSARLEDNYAVRVELDIPKLLEHRKFAVDAVHIDKPRGLEHGTVVEVRNWWREGESNSGFVRQLAGISKKQLADMIGRRYATVLRRDEGALHVSLNGKPCQPYEHCVWGASRFVEHRKLGRIYAQLPVDKVLGRSRRCVQDSAELEESGRCPACEGGESREVVQRVRGWVGIQRYDDANEYGIDLVRNGRTIRAGEKSAFFSYTNPDTGVEEREYPMDSQYGRIVGEIHLDHVPVDFQKQDFQRNTPEWQDAMRYLRGGSLLPSSWEKPGSEPNDSHVSRLFQGYRRVRTIGPVDMYMGQYDSAKGKAVRISRQREGELKERFLNHESGYYDDAKWWELVETANEQPIEELPECEECGFQNPAGAEMCGGCDQILLGKQCRNGGCSQQIARSADTCPDCGESQTIAVQIPWTCDFCGKGNKAGKDQCEVCGIAQGAPHPAKREVLNSHAEESPELSVRGLSVALANGKQSNSIDVITSVVHQPIVPGYQQPHVPLAVHKVVGGLEVYLDHGHSAFTDMGLRPEYLLATEVAQYLYTLHAELSSKPGHTVAALASQVLVEGWGDSVAENADTVRADIRDLFNTIRDSLVGTTGAADFYSELDEPQQRGLADELINSGIALDELGRLKESGAYLRYCDHGTLVAFFDRYGRTWFDGTVWKDPWPSGDEVGAVIASKVQEELHTKYLRCLEDCASYLRYEQPERLLVIRARAAAEFLGDRLA